MEFKMEEHGFVTHVEFGELHVSGNGDQGFRPYQLMVSSIVGCSAGILRKVLSKMRMEVEELKVSVRVKRNPEAANRIEEMDLHFILQGREIPLEKVKKALEVTRKNCAMIQSVQDSIQIRESFEVMKG